MMHRLVNLTTKKSCVHSWDPNNAYKDKYKMFVSNDYSMLKIL